MFATETARGAVPEGRLRLLHHQGTTDLGTAVKRRRRHGTFPTSASELCSMPPKVHVLETLKEK
jgi:hypothetical protein